MPNRDLPLLAGDVEAHEVEPLLERIARRDARDHQRERAVVRLGGDHEPAALRDAHHLVDHCAGVSHVDQQGLACDEVEALVLERQLLGRGQPVAEAVGEAGLRGALGRLLHPARLPVDADERRVRREHVAEQPAPVADARADVEHRAHAIETDPPRPDLDVVEVPPEVALGAEEVR